MLVGKNEKAHLQIQEESSKGPLFTIHLIKHFCYKRKVLWESKTFQTWKPQGYVAQPIIS